MISPAEALLLELGITNPSEIDLAVIASYLGVRIKFGGLEGCEARIIGVRDKAIIRVRADTHPRRQRFSIAHELGHWQLHRGLNLICGATDVRFDGVSAKSREAAANSFAGKLILPGYLLDAAAKQYSLLDFRAIGAIADEFEASRTATAIRLLERRHAPMILVCYSRSKRKWWKRSVDLPTELMPPFEPNPATKAFEVLHGRSRAPASSRRVDARLWFNRHHLDGYKVTEDCLNIGNGEVLVALLMTDARVIDAYR